jgi:hypothetical protein
MYNTKRRTKREMVADATRKWGAIFDARKTANNTLSYRLADGTEVTRLHATDVVLKLPNGDTVLDTGGYNTLTTRSRMPAGVYTRNGVIHVNGVPFSRVAKVKADGTVESDGAPNFSKVNAYMDLYKKHGLPSADESKGDPWVFGDVTPDVMQDWVDSGYRFRLMFVLAMRSAGISDAGIGLYLYDIDRRGGKLKNFEIQRIRRYVKKCLQL